MTTPEARPDASPVIVVTGATGLIGAAIVNALVRRGVRVIGLDQHPPEPLPAGSDFRTLDVTDEASVRAAATEVVAQYGAIDALIHAAALTGRSSELDEHSLQDVDLDLWRRVLEVNLTGALICAREFGPLLRPGPLAQLLLIGSIQGLVPTRGASAYAVSKAALVGLTRQLAAEFADHDVRVNLVSPGPVADDDELARLRAEGVDDRPTPMRRFGHDDEIAESIADLALGAFGLLTGVTIPLDGGEHLRPRTGPKRQPDDTVNPDRERPSR